MNSRRSDICWAVFFGAMGIILAYFSTHWFTLVTAGASAFTMLYLLLRITNITPKEHHEHRHERDPRRRRH